MKLSNPFSVDTRLLFDDIFWCYLCGENGSDCGGLELNHITGRDSASPFNASVLCKCCHEHVGHTQEEEQKLFHITQRVLYTKQYRPTEEDMIFIQSHPRIISDEYLLWLRNNHEANY